MRSEYIPPILDLPGMSFLGGGGTSTSIVLRGRGRMGGAKYLLLGSLSKSLMRCSSRDRPSPGIWLTGLNPRKAIVSAKDSDSSACASAVGGPWEEVFHCSL